MGEPPATRGYPPSTFAMLAQLLERAGTGRTGSVTGIYCPTTNETPGEWVSFVHHGRLVTVSRTSKPTGESPYKDALVSYARWLAQKL